MAIQSLPPRQVTSEAVAARLRLEVKRGELGPGHRLRQEEIAARLGVSTTPVREAFQLLRADGLLRTDPHRGTVVAAPSTAEIRDAYEIREVLECLAIEKAMPRITGELEGELEGLLDRMEKAETSDWIELNGRFHSLQYEASNRPRLCSILRNVSDAAGVYLHMVIYKVGPPNPSNAEHRRILEAIESRDVEAAKHAIAEHLRRARDAVISILGADEGQDIR